MSLLINQYDKFFLFLYLFNLYQSISIMKRLLVISYYFPPSGGPSSTYLHIQYLPEFGWELIVFTVKDGDYPARDESLLKKIPETT